MNRIYQASVTTRVRRFGVGLFVVCYVCGHLAVIARADMLTVGAQGTNFDGLPSDFGAYASVAGPLASGFLYPGDSGAKGVLTSQVFVDNNPSDANYGDLLFEYQITAPAGDDVARFSLPIGTYSGVAITDYGYSGSSIAPSYVELNANGSLRVQFADANDDNLVVPASASDTVFFETNAKTYTTTASVGVIDSSSTLASALVPVPEPRVFTGIAGLSLMLGAGLVWQLRRRETVA